MKKIAYYENLPETMDQVSVENEFEELLASKGNYESNDFLECLYEVSSRQVLNYCLIDRSLIQAISSIIIEEWNTASIDSTESCIAIIINLGLQEAWEYMIGKVSSIDLEEIRAEILETYKEVGNSVEDVSII
ncbi:hypothetical protein D0436_15665 [Shewanella decolorationis]|uniref:Uncharacterized protein n=1 Tax=Shewanella decolorationis TaxID=256839 RepID=A0A5B8R0Q9_9GAMM|nr:hypothetical protein [Shewanella decolorationis]QDZ91781.1 hypothetical protein D0436_15665 [Shewanella decolorationis]